MSKTASKPVQSGKVELNSLEFLLCLNYPVTFYPETEGGYTVEIKDLPGCLSQGETLDEAMEMIQDAKFAWIKVNLELGKAIPLPSTTEEHSGKFLVRLPKSIHRQLAETADREGVSLNALVVSLLSESVGAGQALAKFEQVLATQTERLLERTIRQEPDSRSTTWPQTPR